MSLRHEILRRVETTEVLPAQTARLAAMLQDADVDPVEVRDAIAFDGALTAGVLKAANSAMSGSRVEISSVGAAFARLGSSRLLAIVLAHDAPALSAPVDGYSLPSGALWEQSVAAAIATEELARVLKTAAPAVAFTAGLLCDVGKILLGSSVEVHMQSIRNEITSNGLTHDAAERAVLGIDHAEVGGLLLERWGLPAGIVAAVRWHHEPDRCPAEHRYTAELVHLAEHICLLGGFGCGADGMNYVASEVIAARLGINIRAVETTLCSTVARLNSVREVFGVIAQEQR